MAVFRVERNSGYTVMSNHHLRNKELTLKAKGLLSQMLSLPEDWDYTLAGLSHINRESIDAIRTAVWELEKAGYILRRQGRDEKGKMTAIEYTIYEQPQPVLENPIPGKPMLENPTTDNPTSENPTQLNKDRSRTNLSKKEKSITNLSSTDSFPILSPDPSPCRAAPERKGTEAVKQSAVDIYREIIMENIEYDALMQNPKMDKERLDEIVDLKQRDKKKASQPEKPRKRSLKELAKLDGADLTPEEAERLAAHRQKKAEQHKAWRDRQKSAQPPKPQQRTLKELARCAEAGLPLTLEEAERLEAHRNRKKAALQDLKARAETDPVAAAELAQQRAQQSEAVKKSRQKMYADAAAGDPEAQARYERMLAARRENYHRKKQAEAEAAQVS